MFQDFQVDFNNFFKNDWYYFTVPIKNTDTDAIVFEFQKKRLQI